jgi:hypothetical protein
MLTYYPHYSDEQSAARFATRVALEARRNAAETLFSSLKVGHKLGLRGAGRTRLQDPATIYALISLAFTLKTSLVLGHLRQEQELLPGIPTPLAHLFAA